MAGGLMVDITDSVLTAIAAGVVGKRIVKSQIRLFSAKKLAVSEYMLAQLSEGSSPSSLIGMNDKHIVADQACRFWQNVQELQQERA